MKFHVIVMYVNESKRLMEIKQNPYLKQEALELGF
ncbi:hypothetical protein DET55_105146 [Bacillus mycoides]|uniref:Uncharacterized protein n=1 Tax=Bacillus mycoides TaxID=1405 RepID=A0A3D9VFS8_BACMY|nr:hypothetical protein DET63_10698 [Bacillus sp. DB-2]REF39533.1 hypothetical protein DET55_105146 [Bacillus mycoides]